MNDGRTENRRCATCCISSHDRTGSPSRSSDSEETSPGEEWGDARRMRTSRRRSESEPFPCTTSNYALFCMCNLRMHTIAARLNRGRRLPHMCLLQRFFAPTKTSHPWIQNSNNRSAEKSVFSSLNALIEGLNLAGNLSSITPAKVVFSTVRVILTMIRVSSLAIRKGPLQADKMYIGLDDQ